jgi:hypothetical protein
MQPQNTRVRKMRPPRPGDRNREASQSWYAAGRAVHYVTMEVWPPLTPGDYPMQLAEHQTAITPDPREFEAAVRAGLPDGWTGYIASHNRFKCVPAHPGRD